MYYIIFVQLLGVILKSTKYLRVCHNNIALDVCLHVNDQIVHLCYREHIQVPREKAVSLVSKTMTESSRLMQSVAMYCRLLVAG